MDKGDFRVPPSNGATAAVFDEQDDHDNGGVEMVPVTIGGWGGKDSTANGQTQRRSSRERANSDGNENDKVPSNERLLVSRCTRNGDPIQSNPMLMLEWQY